MTSRLSSVEPPSITTTSARGYSWPKMLARHSSRKRPWLYEGTTTLIRGSSTLMRRSTRVRVRTRGAGRLGAQVLEPAAEAREVRVPRVPLDDALATAMGQRAGRVLVLDEAHDLGRDVRVARRHRQVAAGLQLQPFRGERRAHERYPR